MPEQDLLAALRRRTDAFEVGDPRPVIETDALSELIELMLGVRAPGAGIPFAVMAAAGGLHWCRVKALGAGAGSPELAFAASLLSREIDRVEDQQMDHRYLGYLCSLALSEASAQDDPALLDWAIELGAEMLAAGAPASPDRPGLAYSLGRAYRLRYQRSRAGEDLDRAVDWVRAALNLLPEDRPEWQTVGDALASLIEERFRLTRQQADLDELAGLRGSELTASLRRRIEAYDQGDQDAVLEEEAIRELVGLMMVIVQEHGGIPPAEIAAVMGGVHCRRYLGLRARGQDAAALEELERAALYYSDVAEATPAAVPAQVLEFLADPAFAAADVYSKARLALAMVSTAEDTGDVAMLTQSIDLIRACLRVAGPDFQGRVALHGSLGHALRLRFERLGSEADLALAVQSGQSAVDASAAEPERRGGALLSLGAILAAAFNHRGGADTLNQAIELLREALAIPIEEDPAHLLTRSNLSGALLSRFQHFGDTEALSEAIPLLRAVLAQTPDGDRRRALRTSNLANSLRSLFELSGERAPLEEAVRLGRQAVAAAGPAERAAYQSSLGQSLRLLFEQTRDGDYLDEALRVSQQAVEQTAAGEADLARRLSNVSMMLLTRFQRLGHEPDLTEAARTGRQAADLGSAGQPDHARALSSLGAIRLAQFHRTHRGADLREALQLSRNAVDESAPDDPDRPALLSNLSVVLQSYADYDAENDELARTVQLLREAAAPLSADRRPASAAVWSNLSAVLAARLRHDDRASQVNRLNREPDPETADDAVRFARGAVAAAADGSHQRAVALSNLSAALQLRFEITRRDDDLTEALARADQALSLMRDGDPESCTVLSNRAQVLLTRYERDRVEDDLAGALSGWSRAAELSAAPVTTRLTSAGQAARAAARWLGLDAAVDAYATAIDLLPLLAQRAAGFADQQRALQLYAGPVVREGAACAIAAGRLEEAVQMLEQGRGIYWSHVLDLRTDLTDLARSWPELAAGLAECRSVLEQPMPPDDSHGAAAARLTAARRFDELTREVRSLPPTGPFPHPERFLRPVRYQDLVEADDARRTAIINVSQWRCDALVVSGGGITAVPLTTVTETEVVQQANGYLRALASFRSGALSRPSLEAAMNATLAWLWRNICLPVLDAAGYPARAVEPWPRLWWCPTGALAILPLHAAGLPAADGQSADGQSVYDRVVSSYTPTLRALTRSGPGRWQLPAGRDQPTMLVVAVPEVAGAGREAARLAGPGMEVSVLSRHFSPEQTTILTGEEATHAAILRELGRHRGLHASCHGTQDLRQPSAGGLAPYDERTAGRITLADLTKPELTGGEFAFLAACQTATIGTSNPDETITLCAAMQHAGWRHVIGTLWSVQDLPAVSVTATFYAGMFEGGQFTPDNAAVALHRAISQLRRGKYAGNPSIWSPYIHVGP